MKSFLFTLVTWGTVFGALEWRMRDLFAPPGDWVGALLISFFIALAIGALRKAWIDGRDSRLIANAGGELRDGVRVAVSGTIEPLGATLLSPFTNRKCVAYDYEISHIVNDPRRASDGERVMDRSGLALTPCAIRGEGREVRLMAYPAFEDFDWSTIEDAAIIRRYIDNTHFEPGQISDAMALVSQPLAEIRKDWRVSSFDDLSLSTVRERYVPAGEAVCVVGCYSTSANAIVPQANMGGVRLVRGTRSEAARSITRSRTIDLVLGLLFLVPALATWGILIHREHYAEREGRGSLRIIRNEAFSEAAHNGNVVEMQRLLARGAEVNGREADGSTALMHAPTTGAVSLLIDAGADVNAADQNGFTPLMDAAASGRSEIIRLLLRHGADARRHDKRDQRTAFDFAKDNDHPEAAKILAEAGGKD